MHRHAPKCTPEALEEKLRKHVLAARKAKLVRRRFHYLETDHPDYPLLAMEALIRKDPDCFAEVLSDWSAIKTTTSEVSTGDMIDEVPEIKGIFQLDNGVSVIGLELGAVEHHPVYAVMYHDGRDFRGYIPDAGNVYNRDTKTAFGLDPMADGPAYVRDHGEVKDVHDRFTAAQKLSGGFYYPLGFNSDEIESDLNRNICAINAMAA